MRVAGVDIGGTSIKLGIFNEKGMLIDFVEYNTESQKGGRHLLQTLIQQIEKLGNVDAIGISTAGQVDRENGVIVQEAANIPNTSDLQVKFYFRKSF